MPSKWKILLLFAAIALPATAIAVEPVDINRATVAELLTVPGMTASWAGRIVRFRPYRTKLDLLERGVVTAEVYRRIRDGVIAHRLEANEKQAAGSAKGR
jgi:DNA uptake protein ComE-like DNA-binding protein